jgi:hypothetical protein
MMAPPRALAHQFPETEGSPVRTRGVQCHLESSTEQRDTRQHLDGDLSERFLAFSGCSSGLRGYLISTPSTAARLTLR